jgi:small-conductance mechanosensitive channel
VADLFENISLWFQSVLTQISENAGLILTAFIALLVGIYISRGVSAIVQRGLRYRQTGPEITLLLGRIVQWTIIVAVILFSAQQIGVDITAILAGLGILGFTLGFALQDVSKNFIAGLLLLWQQPFKLGDTIQVSGFTGTILDINLRDTELRTMDGLRVRIPNGEIFTQPVLNFTGVYKRRLQIRVGVAYDVDLNTVRQIALKTIKSIRGVLEDPGIDVRFESFGDYAVQMNIFYWFDAHKTEYSHALDSGISGLKAAFEQAGIEIPIPYRELRLVDGHNGKAEIIAKATAPGADRETNPVSNTESN